jgi:acyl carrier protein
VHFGEGHVPGDLLAAAQTAAARLSPRPRPWSPLIRPGEQRLLDPTLVNRLDVRPNWLDVRGSVIQDRIRDVLAAHGRMAVDPREVDDQADLYKLGLTSHASVDVMLALEDAFGVEFPDEVLKKSTFASIRNIEQVVDGLVKSSA